MEKTENIPISRLKWLDKVTMRRKMPRDHFLDQEKRLFPVKNENGTYNCYLIRAALVRAAALHRRDIEEKARKLYYSLCAKAKKHSEHYLYAEIDVPSQNEVWLNVFPYGSFVDPDYGLVEFFKDDAEQIVNNFKKGLPVYEPPLIDKEHITEGKFGEVVDTKAGDDGLYALIHFSDEAMNDIKNNKFRYLSPVIQENYMNKDTGEVVGKILKGVALTNMPRIPGMLPIQAVTDIHNKSFADRLKSLFGGGEPEDILSDYEMKTFFETEIGGETDVSVEEFNEKLTALKEENKKLKERVQKLTEEKFNDQIENWGKQFVEKGVAPANVKLAVEVLKKEPMKFSDEDGSLKKVFEKMFENQTAVDTKQYSNGIVDHELGDEEIAKKDAHEFFGGEK